MVESSDLNGTAIPTPDPRLRGHHGRGDRKNMRARRPEKNSELLSSGPGMVEALWDSQQLWLSTQAQASQNCRTVGEGVMGLLPPLVEGLSEVDGCGEGSHSPSSMPTWAAVIGLSRLLTKRKKRK